MIKAISVVYANLIREGLKTESAIPNPEIRKQATAVVAVQRMKDREITYAELMGAGNSTDSYFGIAKNDTVLVELIKEYAAKVNATWLLTN